MCLGGGGGEAPPGRSLKVRRGQGGRDLLWVRARGPRPWRWGTHWSGWLCAGGARRKGKLKGKLERGGGSPPFCR